MYKRMIPCLLSIIIATLFYGCTNEDDAMNEAYNYNYSGGSGGTGDYNGNAGHFTSSYSPTLSGNVLSLSIGMDDSDAATYGTTAESVPTDASDNDYEDYVEHFTETARVYITYSESSATVSGADDIEGLSVSCDGADVVVNSSVKGVTYVLSGSSDNASFKMADGDETKKFGLVLNNLNLEKYYGAAINIQSSKRCYLQVEGTNTLSNTGKYNVGDEDQKGCIFSEGKIFISGSGILNVTSKKMHTIASDDYIWIHSGPTLNLKTYDKDGIHANDSVVVTGGRTYIESIGDGIQVDETTGNYVQKGGFVSIKAASGDDSDNSHGVKSAGNILLSGGALQVMVSDAASKAVKADGDISVSGGKQTLITTGNGTYDSEDNDTKGSAGLSADGNITISGGDLRCYSTGSGGKGIKADGTLTFHDGCTVRILTTGTRYSYSSSLHSSPKGIKSTGKMTVNGGTVVVKLTGTGEGTEAIESKDAITINDGYIAAYSYDDAVNSKYDLTVNGGYLFGQSLNNDALDANNNLYINAGVVMAVGAGAPENALDAAEGYNIYINGGWVFGVGGSTAATASGSQQASISYTANVSGKALGLFDSGGNGMIYVSVPSTSCTACYMTAYGMTANSAYNVYSDCNVSGGTTWCGINVTGSVSGGTLLSSAIAAASVGQSMGGGGQPGGNPSNGGRH